MMEDFHDSARRAGEALDTATSVEAEAEARETGRGAASSGSATPQAPTGGGGWPVGFGDYTSSDRRGAVPSGSGAPLATPPPEPVVGGRDRHPRDPLTYLTNHTRAAQRAVAAARRKEHQGPPRPTKRGRI
jgi:hypothetical protein